MESGYPEHYRILPSFKEVGRFVLAHLPTMLPREPLASGDHGASEMLDASLDTQPQLEFRES